MSVASNSTDNRTAVVCITVIVMTLILSGVTATVICALKGITIPDFGVKEVSLALGGGLVGFLTGAGYGYAMAKKPDQAPALKQTEG